MLCYSREHLWTGFAFDLPAKAFLVAGNKDRTNFNCAANNFNGAARVWSVLAQTLT
jgi:hypothetical protein